MRRIVRPWGGRCQADGDSGGFFTEVRVSEQADGNVEDVILEVTNSVSGRSPPSLLLNTLCAVISRKCADRNP
jgi:hypothetical protein